MNMNVVVLSLKVLQPFFSNCYGLSSFKLVKLLEKTLSSALILSSNY